MEYLKIKMPNSEPSWLPIFTWVKENLMVFSSFVLGWKAISLAFKFLSDSRTEEIKKIIDEQINAKVNPQIGKLTSSIDDLKEAIWDLKNKI